LSAIGRAHRDGLLHLDIKPENIIIDRDGQALVTDFGLAQLLDSADHETRSKALAEGPSRRRCTPGYAAPEQVSGRSLDERTDIYSAGVTLYELFSGERPFGEGTPKEILDRSLVRPMPRLTSASLEPPERLSDLICRMTEKHPDMRPPNISAVLAELDVIEREFAGSAVSAVSTPRSEKASARAKRPSLWPSIAAFCFALAALATVLVVTLRGAPPREISSPRPLPRGTPKQPGPPPKKDPQLAAAQKALAQADRIAMEKPAEYARIVAAYREAVAAAENTPLAETARQKLRNAEAQWLDAGRKQFDRIKANAEELARNHRYTEAIALCRPESVETIGDLQLQMARLKLFLEERSRQYLGDLTRNFRAALEEKDFEKAETVLAAIRAADSPNAQKLTQQLARELQVIREKTMLQWAQTARVDFYELLNKSSVAAAKRDYAAALDIINGALGVKAYATIARNLRSEKEGLLEAQSALSMARRQLAATPNFPLRVKGIAGKFVSIEGDTVTVRTPVGVETLQFTELGYKEIVQLVEAASAKDSAAKRHRRLALFLLYDQRFREAKTELDAAVDEGLNMTFYLWRLQMASDVGWDKGREDAVATNLLEDMRRAAAREEWEEVLRIGRAMQDVPGASILREHRREIQRMVRLAQRK